MSARITPCGNIETDRPKIVLDGEWEFSFDAEKKAARERWFAPAVRLPERTRVPGCPQAEPHDSAGAYDTTCDGLPESKPGRGLRYPCFHDAWFKRRFTVPAGWKGQRVFLRVGGVKPAARFWFNGKDIGDTVSSRSTLECDVTELVEFGVENTLTVCVDWRERALNGVHDSIGWLGIYRSATLEAAPRTRIAGVAVRTGIDPPAATFNVSIDGLPGLGKDTRLALRVDGIGFRQLFDTSVSFGRRRGNSELTIRLPMPGARLWDTDCPNRYCAVITLTGPDGLIDAARVRFGLREIKTDGYRIMLNNQPVFLRGGCDDHYYPETIAPPADKTFYLNRLRLAKEYGFNYTKSCVDVFTDEFLEAADEIGYLVCQEMPFGVCGAAREWRSNPPDWLEMMCRRELANIIAASRNHPSVVIYSMASELHAGWLDHPKAFNLFSRDLPALVRKLAPDALVFDCTGASDASVGHEQAVPVRTRSGTRDTDLEGSWLLWNQDLKPLLGPIPGLNGVSRPFIHHEFCWITALSDPRLIKRMAGLPGNPLHVPEMVAAAKRNGILGELPEMERCSIALQYALRKHAMEQARREPKSAGYHHWLIHDFPFCREGVFNEFWERPRGLSGAEFRRYNDDTVLALEDHGMRCFTNGAAPSLAIAISHFGSGRIRQPKLEWQLAAGTRRIASGVIRLPAVTPGSLVAGHPIDARMPEGRTPHTFLLCCTLRDGAAMIAENRWRLWSFPDAPKPRRQLRATTTLSTVAKTVPGAELVTGPIEQDGGVFVTDRLTPEVRDFMQRGGRVLLLAPPKSLGHDLPRADADSKYRTIPYNMGTKGNMGTVIRAHPALDRFPHEGWCDFVFEPLITGAYPFALAPFGVGTIKPIIRSIGHIRTMEDKAYLFEIGFGRGRLLACALALADHLGRYPAADYLLASLMNYLGGNKLMPARKVPWTI